MNLQTVSNGTGVTGSTKARYLTAVCSTALAVAAVAGIGAWQARSHDGASGTAGLQQHVATSIDARPTGTIGGFAPRHSRSFVYYLVGSQGQAGLLESQLQASESSLGTEGPLLEQRAIIVTGSAGDQTQLCSAIDGQGALITADDKPDVCRVIDMRTPEKSLP